MRMNMKPITKKDLIIAYIGGMALIGTTWLIVERYRLHKKIVNHDWK